MNRRDMLKAAALAPLLDFALLRPERAFAQGAVRKLFIYGGDFNRGFVRHAAALTGKDNPRVCFLPTATGDHPAQVGRWLAACAGLPLRPFVQQAFISSYTQKESFEERLTSMDAILVGGGNTLNMLAIWKAQGIDLALRKAWEMGAVVGGGSAGSLCWFEQGTTDSRPGELSTVNGLGWIRASHCPHYHAEPQRKPLYWAKIRSGDYGPGYACDDLAGIYFENEMVKQAVALDEGSNSYHVSLADGEIVERVLPKVLIEA